MKNQEEIKRVEEIIRWSKLSARQFAFEIGYKTAESVYKITRDGDPINGGFATKVVMRFPQINLNWLLKGIPPMILDKESDNLTSEKVENYSRVKIDNFSKLQEEVIKLQHIVSEQAVKIFDLEKENRALKVLVSEQ